MTLYHSSQPVGPQPNPGVNGYNYVGCYSYVIWNDFRHRRERNYRMLIHYQRGIKWQDFDTRHWIRPCGTDDNCRVRFSLQSSRLLAGWY